MISRVSDVQRSFMDISADAYMNEPVRYPALHVVDLEAEGAKDYRFLP